MIRIIVANTFNKRLIGLMGQKSISYAMLFPNVKSIHTFFMKEPIDVIGLDNNNVVVEIHHNIKPWHFLYLNKSKHTLELPNNYSQNIHLGDIISGNELK